MIIHHKNLRRLFRGLRPLDVKVGWGRMVLLVGPMAIKVPRLDSVSRLLHGLASNNAEAQARQLQDERLCPVLAALPGGLAVVMRRAAPVPRRVWKRAKEAGYNGPMYPELKRDSFGLLPDRSEGARMVAVDYGEPYLPATEHPALTEARDRRRAAVATALIAAAAVAGCATTAPTVQTQATDRPQCPPSLLAELRPQPLLPDGATIPRPVTAEDANGLDLTLEHVASVAAWGREGWARAEAARDWCLRDR